MSDFGEQVNYSGEGTADKRLSGLRVFVTEGNEPVEMNSPDSPPGQRWNWTRRRLADWLKQLQRDRRQFTLGIDHALSFPQEYFREYRLATWDEFLQDFVQHWPTHLEHTTVDDYRQGNQRSGDPRWMRLTEKWTSSSKSVFQFDVQGQVAKSTHAGLPWIHLLREALKQTIHFWPFDGWEIPDGKSVVAEVYPSIFRRRYPPEGRNEHQQDAYATARWLKECADRSILNRYFQPPLTEAEKQIAALEGWILGVS